MTYIQDQHFSKREHALEPLAPGDYEYCQFTGCDFSNAILSGWNFIDCNFNNCNLSSAVLNNTGLRDVRFKDCKILGVQFGNCSDFLLSVDFEGCVLNHSSFCKLKLKKTQFRSCTMHDVDFSGAELPEAVFSDCDLLRSLFEQCNLEKADFRSARNYSIDPERNLMKKAVFSLAEVVGLLDKYGIVVK